MKKVLLYVLLVILISLLLLPVGLKTFGKNLYVDKTNVNDDNSKEEIKDAMLKCIKGNETITTTYTKGAAYSFWYQIVGASELNDSDNSSVQMLNDIKNYAKYSNSELSGVSDYKIAFYSYGSNIPTELINYSMPINDQSNYYSDLGFVCLASNI